MTKSTRRRAASGKPNDTEGPRTEHTTATWEIKDGELTVSVTGPTDLMANDAFVSRLMQTSSNAEVEVGDDATGLDELDPDTTEARDASHFRRIVAANMSAVAADQELRDAVTAARDAGESWTVIGAALGITRQGAYQ